MVIYLVGIEGENRVETHFDIIEVGPGSEWDYVVWFDGFTMINPHGKQIGKARAVMPHANEDAWEIPCNWTWG